MANAPPAPPTSSPDESLQRIPLAQIRPNPFQLRKKTDQAALQKLLAIVRERGVLPAIVLRSSAKGGYELVAGHPQVEACRLLLQAATTDEERSHYATLHARVRPNVSDSEMLASAIIESDYRSLSLLELSAERLRGNPDEPAAGESSPRPVLDRQRVRRLARLALAPDFIKQACTDGLLLPSGKNRREPRWLDPVAALELQAAHDWLAMTAGPPYARKQVEPLVHEALEEDWPFVRIEEECHALTGKRKKAPAAPRVPRVDPGPGAADEKHTLTSTLGLTNPSNNPGFTIINGGVIIHRSKLATLTPEQREEVQLLIQKLISRLRE